MLLILVTIILAITWWFIPYSIYPSSACSKFLYVGQKINAYTEEQIDSLATEDRGRLCKIPGYMIANPAQCPSDFDWKKAKDKIKCDTSSEGGMLGTNGVILHL